MIKIYKSRGAVLALLVLGVVGNGVWGIAVRAPLYSARDFFLNITSLGIQSLKDDTYKTIARGFHEAASYETYSMFIILCCAVLLLASLYYMPEKLAAIRDKKKSLEATNAKWLVRISSALFVAVVLFTGWAMADSVRHSYINSAVTHYQQALAICEPYLSDNHKKRIVSSFAQIKNRDDYVSVLDKLENIVKQNQRDIPHFEAW